MIRTWQILLIANAISISSCLELTDFETPLHNQELVVDGFVSTKNEPHYVKLTTLAGIDALGNNLLGQNAHVEIQEVNGPRVILGEISPGRYQLEAGALVVEEGKSYQLHIRLQNGDTYSSSVETVPKPINVVSSEAVLKNIADEDVLSPDSLVHNIEMEIENIDDNHFFITQSDGWAKVKLGFVSCKTRPPPSRDLCWQFRESIDRGALNIQSNIGLSRENYKITSVTIPVDSRLTYIGLVDINAMPSSSYEYWRLIKEQLDRPGGLFDAPFRPITGNILNESTNISALGFFHTYATTSEIVCYDRSEVNAVFETPWSACIRCVEWYPNSTWDNIDEILCSN
ncbi:MAG: DUF4249 family protein [Cyclobacteriaceae bacterium]